MFFRQTTGNFKRKINGFYRFLRALLAVIADNLQWLGMHGIHQMMGNGEVFSAKSNQSRRSSAIQQDPLVENLVFKRVMVPTFLKFALGSNKNVDRMLSNTANGLVRL